MPSKTLFFRSLELLLIIFLSCPFSFGQDKKVTARYKYVASKDETDAQAEQRALHKAQIQAIAKEFKTLVSETNTVLYQNINGEYHQEFCSLGESDVRGEWIQTTKGPSFAHSYQDGKRIIEVEVEGIIRPINTSQIDLDIRWLFRGTDPEADQLRNNAFKDRDNMYLYFRSPVEGYLAVYIVDDDDVRNPQVACLLPYMGQPDASIHIMANKDYIFFSKDKADESLVRYTKSIRMNCRDQLDYNHLYVIFSPLAFNKAVDAQTDPRIPPPTRFQAFQKWLGKNRKNNDQMQVNKFTVSISK
jgi:hypothetical protein